MSKQSYMGPSSETPVGGNPLYFPCFTIKGLHQDLLLGFTRSLVAAARVAGLCFLRVDALPLSFHCKTASRLLEPLLSASQNCLHTHLLSFHDNRPCRSLLSPHCSQNAFDMEGWFIPLGNPWSQQSAWH